MTPSTEREIDVVRSLVRAAGGADRPIHADVEATEYDWHVPNHFSREQMATLGQLGTSLGEALSKVLGERLRRAVDLRALPPTQHFRPALAEALGADGSFRIVLTCGEEPCGLAQIRVPTAVGWVSRLLGAETEEDRDLSELETELLADTVSMLGKAISGAVAERDGQAIQLHGSAWREGIDLPGQDDTEYCSFVFKTDPAGDREDIRLAIRCDALDALVGQVEAQEPSAGEQGNEKALLQEHFARTAVRATVRVGRAELTVRDLMNLEAGDVILLPMRPDEPIEVRVGDHVVSLARAVVSGGQYAVEILAPAGGKDRHNGPRKGRDHGGSNRN